MKKGSDPFSARLAHKRGPTPFSFRRYSWRVTSTSVLRALLGGSLIGLAVTLALLSHGRVAGISGMLGRVLDGDGGRTFRIPFLIALVAVGAIAAAVTPASFGAPVRGAAVLAVAGVLVGVGTTLGNGCTSGHGVCGISRFSLRSVVATMTFMLAGGITVAIAGAHG
ncbi:MAG: YeeE/YedE family protein [Deltaproteobacteria bacterium]|nr:YeeE/YedE family protein [Deltaproteobacteria bacterium]